MAKYTGEEKRGLDREADDKWSEEERDKFRRNMHRIRPYVHHIRRELEKGSNGDREKVKGKLKSGLPLIGDLLD